MIKCILLAVISIMCVFIGVRAQPVPETNNQNIFAIYEKQFRALLTTRGVASNDISVLLRQYSSNQLNSDSAFAHLLQQLYSSKKDIGILFYFFNSDTLRRAYYKPGKIVEVKNIPIKKATLLQLGADINQSLDLYQQTAKRAPQTRGNILIQKPSTKISFGTAVKNATQILIPTVFDTDTKHLLIIPALNIGTIPFHLLQPYADKTQLVERCSYTIVPSLIDLVALRTKILKKNFMNWDGGKLPANFDSNEDFLTLDKSSFLLDNALFVSNPAYPADGNFIFPNLPGAEREIDSVKQYATKYILLKGIDATKESVVENIQNADVAYFATHGIADQEDPMGKSFLVLSGNSPYLTAKEIMGMNKANIHLPELVILSACQTGLGKSMEAGTAGLARSFLLGGSNHVIMSLWNVDDDATAYLMSRFIYHLQTPHRFMPAEPLRLAILDTKKIFKNPAKWASFSLFGIDY